MVRSKTLCSPLGRCNWTYEDRIALLVIFRVHQGVENWKFLFELFRQFRIEDVWPHLVKMFTNVVDGLGILTRDRNTDHQLSIHPAIVWVVISWCGEIDKLGHRVSNPEARCFIECGQSFGMSKLAAVVYEWKTRNSLDVFVASKSGTVSWRLVIVDDFLIRRILVEQRRDRGPDCRVFIFDRFLRQRPAIGTTVRIDIGIGDTCTQPFALRVFNLGKLVDDKVINRVSIIVDT